MQQNVIKMQKIKLKHPQRTFIMPKLLDVTNEAENHSHDKLGPVSKYRYGNSVSKDSKTKSLEQKLELETKGRTISKFVTKIHPRALERRIRHEEAQQRREAFEHKSKSARLANEERYVIISFENFRFFDNFFQTNFFLMD